MRKESKTAFLKDNLTIDGATDAISVLESDDVHAISNADIELKSYTSYTNQLVVASNEYVYKIYENTNNKITFDHVVREALAEVYEELGLVWNFVSFERDGSIFDFEERQTLRVCTPEEDGPFENIILSMSAVYDEVEKLLHFDEILLSLKKRTEFAQVEKLCLTRAIVNKYNDYAMFGNQAILLDDADFCVVLLDGDNKILDIEIEDKVVLSTSLGEFKFRQLGGNVDNQGKINIAARSKLCDIFHAWELVFTETKDVGIVKVDRPIGSRLLTSEDAQLAMNVMLSTETSESNGTEPTIERQDHKQKVTITSLLTDAAEKEVYEQLCGVDFNKFDVCLLTSINGEGGWLDEDRRVRWASHMKTITSHFPSVEKQTKIFLTKEFCDLYLEDGFDISEFSGGFGTKLVFLPPLEGLNGPSREMFKKFLLKFARNNSDYFLNLFTNETIIKNSAEIVSNCGHDFSFRGYSDCGACMFCDFEIFREAFRERSL